MNENNIRETMDGWDAIDDLVQKSGGSYVAYSPITIQDYDYRAMSHYARSKGYKSSMELSEEERKQFEFDPPLVFRGGVEVQEDVSHLMKVKASS